MKQTPYPCPACKGHGCAKCGKTGTLKGWNDRKVEDVVYLGGARLCMAGLGKVKDDAKLVR